MYYLNKDGSIDNGSDTFIDNSPIEIISFSKNEVTGETESRYNLVEPHVVNCKCVKCFVKNKVGSTLTCNNAFMVIIFLIFVYLVYLALIRIFY